MNEPSCPHCGAALHPNSRGCPNCGARKGARGWSPPPSEEGLDLETIDDFDYDRFLEEEFGDPAAPLRRSPKELFWWMVAIIVLVAFGLLVFRFGG